MKTLLLLHPQPHPSHTLATPWPHPGHTLATPSHTPYIILQITDREVKDRVIMAANEASVAVSEETLEGCALMEDEKKKITPPEKEVLSIFSNLQDNFELEQDLSEVSPSMSAYSKTSYNQREGINMKEHPALMIYNSTLSLALIYNRVSLACQPYQFAAHGMGLVKCVYQSRPGEFH